VDRTTDIRRVKFDLLGFPPTLEEIDASVADLLDELLFQDVQSLKVPVALAAFQPIDAWRFQNLAARAPARGLFFAAAVEPLRQAFLAAEGVGLQLFGDAVAPAGRNLEDGRTMATIAVTQDRVRWHHQIANCKL